MRVKKIEKTKASYKKIRKKDELEKEKSGGEQYDGVEDGHGSLQ